MKPDSPGYKLTENDVASQSYRLVYGQRFQGFALWRYVGWREGVPVSEQKQRTTLAYVLTKDEVIVAVVDGQSIDLGRMLYEQCSTDSPPIPAGDAPVYLYTFLLKRELCIEKELVGSTYLEARETATRILIDDLANGDFDETGDQSIQLLKMTDPEDAGVNWHEEVVA